MKLNYKRPPLTAYQRAIIDSPARFTFCEASTKSGKSASHIVWLFEQSLRGKIGFNYWWVAPIFQQAEIAFKRMQRQITVKNFFKVNQAKLTLELINGATIFFKSADKPDSLYGDDVHAVVIDEISRCKEDSWFAIRSTLTKTEGKCKCIGNVKGKGNWAHKLCMKAKAGEDNSEYFKITAYQAVEAGILKLEEIEQAKRDLPEKIFRELYLAEPSDDGGNPFGLKHIQDCIKPMSQKLPVVYGVDLAKSFDYTVIIGLDEDMNVCFFDRWQADWAVTRMKLIKQIGFTKAAIDSTGVGDPVVEDIIRDCPNVESFKFSNASKQNIMQGLEISIQKNEIGFPDGIIVNELEVFEYEYSGGVVKYNAPSGFHDDTVCALALARHKFVSKNKNIIIC